MSTERRNRIRVLSGWIRPERVSARKGQHRQWIVRWIGVGRDKPGNVERQVGARTSSVEYLRWEDTFGKAAATQTNDSPNTAEKVVKRSTKL